MEGKSAIMFVTEITSNDLLTAIFENTFIRSFFGKILKFIKILRNNFIRVSFRIKSFTFVMANTMFRLGVNKFKIFNHIIGFIAVFVMDNFRFQKRTTDVIFHNEAMKQSTLSIYSSAKIAIFIQSWFIPFTHKLNIT